MAFFGDQRLCIIFYVHVFLLWRVRSHSYERGKWSKYIVAHGHDDDNALDMLEFENGFVFAMLLYYASCHVNIISKR